MQEQQLPQSDMPVLEEFLPVLYSLRRIRRHLTTVPTNTPKTFADQIQLYDDGTNRRVYFFVNNIWRYITLT
jgi:hypothetical protein